MNKIVKILFFISILFSFQNLIAQTQPSGILFQAVARDASNNAAANRTIYAIVEIREATSTGSTVYSESHQVLSNDEGIFNLIIGNGTRLSGATKFDNLNWRSQIYFINLKVAIAPSLPTPGWDLSKEYVDMGTSQIWAVPYAFSAFKAVIADSATKFGGVLAGESGGTGINNTGKTITLGRNFEIQGLGNLKFNTTGLTSLTLPQNGRLINTDGIDTLLNKFIVSPMLLGKPLAPTADSLSNDSTVANIKYVKANISKQFEVLKNQFSSSIDSSSELRLKISDTSAMLTNRIKRDTSFLLQKKDTITLSNRIDELRSSTTSGANLKVNISDTSVMLSNRFERDTISLSNRINTKVNTLNARIDSSLYVNGKVRIDSVLNLNDSLRVIGNVKIDSNLIIGGKLTVASGLDFRDSLTVTRGARIDSSLLLKGKLLLGDSLIANGSAKIDNNLLVGQRTRLNDSLTVMGVTRLNDSLTVNGRTRINDSLLVRGNTKIDNNLLVSQRTRLNDSLTVMGVTRLNDSLTVNGRTRINDSLLVRGNVKIDSNLIIGGKLTVASGLDFRDSLTVTRGARIDSSLLLKGKLLLGDSLIANGSAKIDNNLLVGQRTRLNDSLTVMGVTRLNDSLTVNGRTRINDSLLVRGNVKIDSNLIIGGKLTVASGLDFRDSLTVTRGARIDSSLLLKGKLLLGDSLIANGSAKIDNNLLVGQRTRLNDSLTVMGVTRLNDSLTVNGRTRINDSLLVRGNTKIDNNLLVSQRTRLNDSLTVMGVTRLNDSLTVNGRTRINDSLLVRGNTKIDNNLLVSQRTRLNDSLTVMGVTRLNDSLTVNGRTRINDSLLVRGNVKIDSNLIIGGKLTVASGLDFRDSLTVTRGARIDSSLLLKGKLLITDSLIAKSAIKVDGNILVKGLNVSDSILRFSDSIAKFSVTKLNAADTASLSNRIGTLSSGSNKFTADLTVNYGGGSFGKYTNGQTIPAAGKTIDEVFRDILTKVIHPSYSSPTASLTMPASGLVPSGTAASGNIEIGTNLGTLTFNPSFNKLDGGDYTSITYKKNGGNLGSSTDNVSQLTTQISYQVTYAYGAGTSVKKNNLNEDDVTNQVQAGSVNSNTVTITPASYKYWGMTTNSSANITDADIIAMVGGNKEWATSKLKSSFTITGPGVAGPVKYAFYAVPNATSGTITSITAGGFESIAAFDKVTRNFTNAQGYVVSYDIYVQKNSGTDNVTLIIQ